MGDYWMATMPVSKISYSYANRGSCKINFRTQIRSPNTQSCQGYSGDKSLLVVYRETAFQISRNALRRTLGCYKIFHYY